MFSFSVMRWLVTVVSLVMLGSVTPAVAQYTTWNPADKTNITLTNSNLTATATAANSGVRGTPGSSSGKLYFEYTIVSGVTSPMLMGMAQINSSLIVSVNSTAAVGIALNGNISVNNSASGSSIGSVGNTNVIGVAVDLGANLIWFRVAPSGNWNGSGTASPGGTGGISISSLVSPLYPILTIPNGCVVTANFGGSAFTGAVPSGFTAGIPAGGGGAGLPLLGVGK